MGGFLSGGVGVIGGNFLEDGFGFGGLPVVEQGEAVEVEVEKAAGQPGEGSSELLGQEDGPRTPVYTGKLGAHCSEAAEARSEGRAGMNP